MKNDLPTGAIIPTVAPYRFHKLDDLNWCLQESKTSKSGKSKGQQRWENVYYYPTLGMACGDLARILADDPAHADEVATLRDYADLLHRKCKELEATVNEAISAVEATKGTRHA